MRTIWPVVNQLRALRAPLASCWPVITEAAWLLRKYPRAIALLAAFSRRPIHDCHIEAVDVVGITAIFNKYKNLNLQLADAASLHLANREARIMIFNFLTAATSARSGCRMKKLRLLP